ncbi:hypothetical protein P3S68_008063 [Capsicum galapagoense]
MMNSLFRGLCRQSRKRKELSEDAYHVFVRMQSQRLFIDPALNQQGILLNAYYFYDVALKCGVVPKNKPELYLPRNGVFNWGNV